MAQSALAPHNPQCHGEKIPDWWGSGQNIHRQTPPSAAHRKEQHSMWRAATQREGSVTVLPSTSRWGGLVSDPGPPWSSNSQSPHRDDASGAQTSHKAPYIFSFILVLSVITLWNKAEPQPLHWCQPSSIRRRGSVGWWMWSTWTFERALNQLTMPSLTCPWRSIILSPKQAKWSFEDHDGEVIEPYRTETSAHTRTFFFWIGTGSPLLWPWGSQTRPPSTPPCRIRVSVMNQSTARLSMFTALPCPLVASLPALGSLWFFIHDVPPKL